MPALSKQSNIELYLVKIFLNQVEIGKYLPTYQEGRYLDYKKKKKKKKNLIRDCNQILLFCQG